MSSRSSGISGTILSAASMNRSMRSTSCAGDSTGAGRLVELQKRDDLRDVLGKDKFVAARQHRDRARAEALQLGPAGSVFKYIDRLELDPTDREKLLEFRQLVQPGCQNAFKGAASGTALPFRSDCRDPT